MDVELPDGTVIEGIPDGTTKAQLADKLKSNGMKVPDTWLSPQKSTSSKVDTVVNPMAADDKHSSEEYEAPDARYQKLAAKIKASKPNITPEALHLETLTQLASEESKSGKGSLLKGIGETALTVGSGLYHAAKAGYKSLGALAARGSVDDAVDAIREEESKVYQPKTASGKLLTGSLGAVSQAPNKVGGDVGEAVAGPAGRTIGETLPSALPLVKGLAGGVKAAAEPIAQKALSQSQKIAKEFIDEGYAFPPKKVEKTAANTATQAAIGDKTTYEALSNKNQVKANSEVRKTLNLPDDTLLTDDAFSKVRQEAGKKYEAVKEYDGPIRTDLEFLNKVKNLGREDIEQAVKEFPELMKDPEVAELRKAMSFQNRFSAPAGVELVKKLRQESTKNLKSPDAAKQTLGDAQRKLADSVDDLMDRELSKAAVRGEIKPNVVKEYRDARQQIAKSYDIEANTNTVTGNVSSRGISRLLDKGRPLSGEMRKLARAVKFDPRAFQNAEGDFTGISPAEAVEGAIKGGIVSSVVKPAARATLTSDRYQKGLVTPKKDKSGRLPVMMNEVAPAVLGEELKKDDDE